MSWKQQLIETDILAVHAALLHTGDILFFTGNEFWGEQHEQGIFDHVRLFNCRTFEITKVGIPSSLSDLFCSGHAFLGNGNLMIAGGTKALNTTPHHGHSHWYGERKTWQFVADAKRLVQRASLNANTGEFGQPIPGTGGRWYPTLITLGNGRILAIGGHPDKLDGRHSANRPEYFDGERWRYVEGSQDWFINLDHQDDPLEYPRLHLLPDGRIFSSTPFAVSRPPNFNGFHKVMAYELNVGWSAYSKLTPDTPDWRLNDEEAYYRIYNQFNGTSVMLPLIQPNYEARVMVHGNTNSYVINLSSTEPGWEKVNGRPINKKRVNVNSVILPTGEIFFCGGVEGSNYNDSTGVNEAEIYNPFTGQWTLTPPAQVVRNYHSVALLMPDGRVWTAGSSKNHKHNVGIPPHQENREKRIEIFEPWYYGLPTRPVIHQVITEDGNVVTGLRGEFTVITDGANEIERVVIIRNGSVTHGFNSDQRYVGLPFTTQNHQGTMKALRVVIPDNPNIVVPGHYMLFLIDKNGVPSIGTFINIRLGWSYWSEGSEDFCLGYLAAVTFGKNQLDVFAVRTFGEVAHKRWNGERWTSWDSLGGPISSNPVVVTRGSNRIDVFARGQSDELAYKSFDGNSWSNWANLGGPITFDPSVVSWGENRLDVFARGLSGELAHKSWDGNSWSNWANLGGPITSDPCAVSWGENRLDVFARGLSGELAHKFWDGNSWSNWANLGGPIASSPKAISRGKNRLDVFARGLNEELAHKSWDGNSWSNWANLGGLIRDPNPSVVSWGEDRLDIFITGQHGELAYKSFDGNRWSNWANLGGFLSSGPTAVSWGVNRINVVAISERGNILHKYW
jgi:hypothetical protein